MRLTPGVRLGAYEIVAPLGAGGMREVYRARDKKLDRDVAIKVLPQSIAADPDTLARFEREAKAVAALSHQKERGRALVRRAMELDSHHPRWYRTTLGLNEYRLANFAAAVDESLRANAPDVFWTHMLPPLVTTAAAMVIALPLFVIGSSSIIAL